MAVEEAAPGAGQGHGGKRRGGMLVYLLKKPDRRGNTVLVLSPEELLMRLCSLVPAPGHPSRKCFGILATPRKLGHAHPKRVEPVASPVKWAELRKRLWGLDAQECARCGSRMTAMAVVEDGSRLRGPGPTTGTPHCINAPGHRQSGRLGQHPHFKLANC